MDKQKVLFKDLGIIDYKAAWDYQEVLFQQNLSIKSAQRSWQMESDPQQAMPATTHHLLFCEHPPVLTLGKSGHESNILISATEMEEKGIAFYKINRGGDITFHGPQQIVGYPILDLELFYTDIGRYLRSLEEVIILTLADYGITAGRSKGETGVWLDPETPRLARKICAMGVRCSRWITMHGFAFNVNTQLDYFNTIVPCGIQDKAVTSLEKELGQPVDFEVAKLLVKRHFESVFQVDFN